jgi:hypothetical protein
VLSRGRLTLISMSLHGGTTGIRRARYLGPDKTRLEHDAAAAAANLLRLDAWWTGRPYLQAEGYGYLTSVFALRTIAARGHGRAHLDFGSGVGVTSQLFVRAGYETTFADNFYESAREFGLTTLGAHHSRKYRPSQ